LHELVTSITAQVQLLAVVEEGVIVIMRWILQILVGCLGDLPRHSDALGVSNNLARGRKRYIVQVLWLRARFGDAHV
jgi:hypothetical protein